MHKLQALLFCLVMVCVRCQFPVPFGFQTNMIGPGFPLPSTLDQNGLGFPFPPTLDQNGPGFPSPPALDQNGPGFPSPPALDQPPVPMMRGKTLMEAMKEEKKSNVYVNAFKREILKNFMVDQVNLSACTVPLDNLATNMGMSKNPFRFFITNELCEEFMFRLIVPAAKKMLTG